MKKLEKFAKPKTFLLFQIARLSIPIIIKIVPHIITKDESLKDLVGHKREEETSFHL